MPDIADNLRFDRIVRSIIDSTEFIQKAAEPPPEEDGLTSSPTPSLGAAQKRTSNATRMVRRLLDDLTANPEAAAAVGSNSSVLLEMEALDSKLLGFHAAIAHQSLAVDVTDLTESPSASIFRSVVSISKAIHTVSGRVQDNGLSILIGAIAKRYLSEATSARLSDEAEIKQSHIQRTVDGLSATRSRGGTLTRRHQAVMRQLSETEIALQRALDIYHDDDEVAGAGLPEKYRQGLLDALSATTEIQQFYNEIGSTDDDGKLVLEDTPVLVTTESLSGPLLSIRAVTQNNSRDDTVLDELAPRLNELVRGLSRRFEEVVKAALTATQKLVQSPEVRERFGSIIEGFATPAIGGRILEEALTARDQTLQVLESARKAAGEVGSVEHAMHYQRYADKERRIADYLRYATVALLLIIASVAAAIVFRAVQLPVAWIELSKLAIVVPLAVLAAYLGREANRHRQSANWAQKLAMQLMTFDAFIQPLSDTERTRRRTEFAALLFGRIDQPIQLDEQGPSVVAELVSLVDAAGRLVNDRNLTTGGRQGAVVGSSERSESSDAEAK